MVKTKVNWTSTTGENFTFEYEVTMNGEARSVRDVHATIYHTKSSPSSTAAATAIEAGDNNSDSKIASGSGSSRKKRKGEEIVGYMRGYELRRGSNGNKNFYHDADINSELYKFANTLYDSKGDMCKAPRGSPIRDIYCMDGSMFLIELIEIKHRFSGIDLGINFIHEYLSLPTTIKRVGVVVIFPWTISCNMLRYDDNKKRLKDGKDGKSENEKVDISRSDTIKLRRQVSRMGFSAVHSSHPDFVE